MSLHNFRIVVPLPMVFANEKRLVFGNKKRLPIVFFLVSASLKRKKGLFAFEKNIFLILCVHMTSKRLVLLQISVFYSP